MRCASLNQLPPKNPSLAPWQLEYPRMAVYHIGHARHELKEVSMDGETSKDKLMSDLKTLVGDAEELLKATASQAGEKVTVARQKIEQSLIEGKKALADAEKVLIDKSKECVDIADDYVRENPWSAVGIAAGVGLVLGLLIRRS
jgi:ElaB/YqjD/DUF883 family membrane-anchored ribosome-binding protein